MVKETIFSTFICSGLKIANPVTYDSEGKILELSSAVRTKKIVRKSIHLFPCVIHTIVGRTIYKASSIETVGEKKSKH